MMEKEDDGENNDNDNDNETYHGIGLIDLTNAYNKLSRSTILSSIRENNPKLERFFIWAYGNPTPLLINDILSDKYHIIESAQGVRQGDPIAPYFFSINSRKAIEYIYI